MAEASRPLSLRAAMMLATAVIVCLVGGSIVTLILGSTYVHELVVEHKRAMGSVRAAEELRVQLLLVEREGAGPRRSHATQRMSDLFGEFEQLTGSPAERAVVADAQRCVDSYVATRRADTLEAAFDALSRLSALNAEQARATERHAAEIDRAGDVAGIAVGATLAIGLGLVLAWLRAYVLQPIAKLERALREFSEGARATRVEVSGPPELRTMAEQFNQMATALEHERERRLTFLAGVAHDLRNPISAMSLAVAAVPPSAPLPPEPRIRALLALIGRQTTRLARMVGDILDAARFEAGKFDIRIDAHDVRDLAREAVELFEAVSPKHELALEVPDDEVSARCDGARLVQVLNNLLSNAIKYSPKGGRVLVRVVRLASEVRIDVTDEGIGMTQAEREKVFEPFRRVGMSREAIPGVGLGLHASWTIIEAQGGRIEVESEPGHGSTFRVILPAAEPAG